MHIPDNVVQEHRTAISQALWNAEQANPGVDLSALHAALKSADDVLVSKSEGTMQPLDGDPKPVKN